MAAQHAKVIIISCLSVSVLLCASGCTPKSTASSTQVPPSPLERLTNPSQVTPSPTLKPTTTTTPTLPATFTPVPTLTTKQAQTKIRELFETNGRCKLPCWWGITPGISANDAFYNFIQSIAMSNMFW